MVETREGGRSDGKRERLLGILSQIWLARNLISLQPLPLPRRHCRHVKLEQRGEGAWSGGDIEWSVIRNFCAPHTDTDDGVAIHLGDNCLLLSHLSKVAPWRSRFMALFRSGVLDHAVEGMRHCQRKWHISPIYIEEEGEGAK